MTRYAWFGVVWLAALAPTVQGDDWPQWLGPQRDANWKETGILDKFPSGGPKVLWRHDVSLGYAGPAVANGRVYVSDFLPDKEVDLGKVNNPMAGPLIKGKERVLCLDAKSGQEVWKHEHECDYKVSYPGGPRATPTVHEGKLYALGAMGNLVCLEIEKGTVVWKKDFRKDYGAKMPVWGFCSHPLVDGDKLICIVGGENATVVAFDRNTGKELWKALNARHPGYSAPVMIEAGGKRQVLIFDGFNLSGLNPEDGTLYWSVDAAPATQMSIMLPRRSGDLLFASGRGAANAGVMLKLAADSPEVTKVWGTDAKLGINPINMTPYFDGDTIYGVHQDGSLTAVEAATGKRLWQTTAPVSGEKPASAGTAFVVKNGDRFFLFNEMGELVIAKLSPKEYKEIDRAKVLEPTNVSFQAHRVVWSHPAFANKCMFARNDKEIVCVSLAAE